MSRKTSGIKVSIDGMASAMKTQMNLYQYMVYTDLEDAVDRTAEECVDEIKQKCQSYGWKNYAKCWTSKKEKTGTNDYRRIVNATKGSGYRITHLLEKGHATLNGGRTKAYPHVAPAEEHAKERFIEILADNVESHYL